VLIKYVGRRTSYLVRFGRVPYIFSKENDFTLDIKDKPVVSYIFGLTNKDEFEVLEPIVPKEEPKIEEPKVEEVKKTGGKSGKRSKNK